MSGEHCTAPVKEEAGIDFAAAEVVVLPEVARVGRVDALVEDEGTAACGGT